MVVLARGVPVANAAPRPQVSVWSPRERRVLRMLGVSLHDCRKVPGKRPAESKEAASGARFSPQPAVEIDGALDAPHAARHVQPQYPRQLRQVFEALLEQEGDQGTGGKKAG